MLIQCDNAKRHKYGGVCQALGHSFLPMGFTAWGAMSSGTTELLEKVADAAHEQGYVGEAWGTLKGDRIRAMHGLYMGVSYALNKSVAIQLDRAQTEHLFGLCRQIWEPISRSGVGPTTSGSELQTTSTAHNPQQMHRSESLDQSEGTGPNETAGSRVAPGFVRDLSAAYNALSKYDDGLRYPIPPFWMEASRRFVPRACQAQSSGQTTPVLYEGVATIVVKCFPRLQRYFSRRIHSEARDELIAYVRGRAVVSGRSGGLLATRTTLRATKEPAVRAYTRLIQLQGPLAGAFL